MVAKSYDIERRVRDIVLTFRGHYTGPDADETVEAFKELLGDDTSIRFIVDLTQMVGYDKAARELWARVLPTYREQIRKIVFIGNPNPIIRMAASTVALVARIRMEFVGSWDDLKQQ